MPFEVERHVPTATTTTATTTTTMLPSLIRQVLEMSLGMLRVVRGDDAPMCAVLAGWLADGMPFNDQDGDVAT
jgi:hypothetical protein